MPEIPNLLRKLTLLIEYGRFAGMKQLAAVIGKSTKTVYWWGNGGDDRRPGLVPADSYGLIVEIVRDALGGRLSAEQVQAILASPSAFALEEELHAVPVKPLGTLVDEEANRTSGRLFLRPKARARLVEVHHDDVSAVQGEVGIGQLFRIEFHGAQPFHTLILQQAGQLWGTAPHSFQSDANVLHVPGHVRTKAPGLMSEPAMPGRHCFIALQTAAPLPPDIRNLVANRAVFDSQLLNRLASHYLAQPLDRRRLFAMDVHIRTETAS